MSEVAPGGIVIGRVLRGFGGLTSMRQKTAIAVCSDAAFLPAACCQLLSTARHLPSDDAADLFLLCCDVDTADLEEAERFFATRELAVQVLVPDAAALIRPLETRWPRAAYLRLYFDTVFGPEYDRLIYFDADTRVRKSLAPLLDVDLRGNPVGAVHDFIYYVTGNIRRRRRDLFLASDAPYLQSGVMVFDWPATLADRSLARARWFLREHPDRCREAPDQDALNAALEDKWTPLDPRWNLHETYLRFHGRHAPFIEHYTSSKPWASDRPREWGPAAEWYEHELAGTAWEHFIPRQTRLEAMHVRWAFLRFRYDPKVRHTAARYAPWLLDWAGVPRERDEDQPLPWAPPSRAVVERMTAALIDEAARGRPCLRPPEAVLSAPRHRSRDPYVVSLAAHERRRTELDRQLDAGERQAG
jgi:lipopolysaccharide biosynthesis glycosyltransferase